MLPEAGRRGRGEHAVDPGLVKFVEFLARNRVRATYAALAEAAGVSQRQVGALLGARSPLASWVVSASTGEPTGYAEHQKDPHLRDSDEVIVSGAELTHRMKREPRPTKTRKTTMPEAMQVLQNYHRLFLYPPEDSRFVLRLRVVPDAGQAGTRTDPTAVVSLRTLQPLETCLRDLGVTGYFRFFDETPAGPLFEYVPCAVEEILAALKQRPVSGVTHATLAATDSTIAEMKRRVASLRVNAGEMLLCDECA
jgi:hypothetical protein